MNKQITTIFYSCNCVVRNISSLWSNCDWST